MERRSIAKLASQVGGVKLPSHISIKGNVFTAVDDSGARVRIGTTLNCVILDMNEKMSRLFWGADAVYDEDNQTPPLCFSDNGIGPSDRSLEPQAKTCAPDREGKTGCRWSVWGSGRSKKSGDPIPACQNGVKLALMLVKAKGKEWIPVAGGSTFFFRIPPASLKAIASYGKVVQTLGPNGGKIVLPWSGEEVAADTNYVITEVTFSGTGTVQFRAVGYITEQIDGIIDEISQTRVDTIIGRDDVPVAAALPTPTLSERLSAPDVSASALPQPTPAIAATPKPRGRPRKNGNAPVTTPARIVTAEEVRDHAARAKQEAKEAAVQQEENPAFGIVDEAPEPPADVLDQFMQLDLK